MAYRKKHKPCILKYKALISKYMPCIFCLFKCLKDNNLQKLSKTFYSLDLQPVTKHPLKREKNIKQEYIFEESFGLKFPGKSATPQ
jgi:hypothetical protein